MDLFTDIHMRHSASMSQCFGDEEDQMFAEDKPPISISVGTAANTVTVRQMSNLTRIDTHGMRVRWALVTL